MDNGKQRPVEGQNTPQNQPQAKGKPTFAEFTLNGIRKLRKGDFKGIHNVYSGFNVAAIDYFHWTKEELIGQTNKLVEDKVIETRPTKDGFTLYLPGEKPTTGNDAGSVLARMGL